MYPSARSYAPPGQVHSYGVPMYGQPVVANGYGQPELQPVVANGYVQPVVANGYGQPMGYNGYNGYPAYHPYSLGDRFRNFFGCAPATDVRYKSDHGTWGFMGYSRRQRYIDAHTGIEVDRQGRQIFRVWCLTCEADTITPSTTTIPYLFVLNSTFHFSPLWKTTVLLRTSLPEFLLPYLFVLNSTCHFSPLWKNCIITNFIARISDMNMNNKV